MLNFPFKRPGKLEDVKVKFLEVSNRQTMLNFPFKKGLGNSGERCSKISRVTGAACVNSRCVSRWCGVRGGAPPPDSQNKHPRPRTRCWRRWTCPAPPLLGARLQQHHTTTNYKKSNRKRSTAVLLIRIKNWSDLFVIKMWTVYTIISAWSNLPLIT